MAFQAHGHSYDLTTDISIITESLTYKASLSERIHIFIDIDFIRTKDVPHQNSIKNYRAKHTKTAAESMTSRAKKAPVGCRSVKKKDDFFVH